MWASFAAAAGQRIIGIVGVDFAQLVGAVDAHRYHLLDDIGSRWPLDRRGNRQAAARRLRDCSATDSAGSSDKLEALEL